MANFDRSGMTQAGINLMGKAVGGATIQFTRLVLGDGTMTGEILDLKGVVSPKQNVDVTRIERNNSQCTVGGELLTSSVKQGFFWRECGLYAMDPQLGEILYNYAYSTKPDYIASSDSGMMEEILVSMVATVGSNTNVDVTIDDSMVFATKKELNVLYKKQRISVTDFGAQGNGTSNDTDAFLQAINKATLEKKSVYVPSGIYLVDADSIVLPEMVCIIGENSQTTTIKNSQSNKCGIGITLGSLCEIFDLDITHFETGVLGMAAGTKIYNCKLRYNIIGIHYKDKAYMNRCTDNYIAQNNVGILVGNQSYQCIISNNLIEGNRGMGVGLYGAVSGVIIENNTIEGSYNYETNVGCGLFISGSNQHRVIVKGNWFELNGTTDSSAHIYMNSSDSGTGKMIKDAILNSCIPSEYRTLFSEAVSSGSVSIESNFFLNTKYFIVISNYKGKVSVYNNKFSLQKGRYNIPIFLATVSTLSYIDIDCNDYSVTGDSTIELEVEKGVCGTIVFSDLSLGNKNIYYNKKSLYYPELTLNELSSKCEILHVQPYISTGGGEKKRYSLLNKQYDGYNIIGNSGSGGIRSVKLGVDEYSNLLEGKQGLHLIVVGESGSSFVTQDGSNDKYVRFSSGDTSLSTIYDIPQSLKDGGCFVDNSKTIYLVCVLNEENYLKYFNKAHSIKILDFNSQLINP